MARRGPQAPVAHGSRVALLPAREEHGGPGTVYVVGRRPLRYEGRVVPEGVEIPAAGNWLRVHAWVDARRIRVVGPDEDYIPYATWVGPILEAEAEAALAVDTEAVAPTQEPVQPEE